MRIIRSHLFLSIFLYSFFFLFLLGFFYILSRLELQRVTAFGCFDDCFNYVGGYFMLKGKTLYSEIFYNHQMLMAYLSYLLQLTQHPRSIYELLITHRMFVVQFSFVMSLFLVFRFRFIALIFVVLFELTKYYFFADRFLAEALIVYPHVYLLGLVWEVMHKKKLMMVDVLIASICTWFVVFMREPYVPLVIVMLLYILWYTSIKARITGLMVLGILSFITVMSVPLNEYFFNVITVNLGVVQREAGNGLLQKLFEMFFYPFVILIEGKDTIIRTLLFGLSLLFIGLVYQGIQKGMIRQIVSICVLLGLANVRSVLPGTMFYEAFHSIQWYGMFLFIILLLIHKLYEKKIIQQVVLFLFVAGLCIYTIIHPTSYLYDRVNRHEELITNFGNYLSNGEVIKGLSNKNDTLFADQLDDLLYWQTDLQPAYKYSWYFSAMPAYEKYRSARIEMFKHYPPTFYFGFCSRESEGSIYLEKEYAVKYSQLYFAKGPTCLYILRSKIPTISESQWESIKQYEYYLPPKEQGI